MNGIDSNTNRIQLSLNRGYWQARLHIRGRIEARETNQDIREALRATSATEFINSIQGQEFLRASGAHPTARGPGETSIPDTETRETRIRSTRHRH